MFDSVKSTESDTRRLEPPDVPAGFGFTEDHALARQSARRFLQERSSPQVVRTLAEDPLGFDRETWSAMAELGWVGLALPEELGGLGLDGLHLAILLDEMGRVLLPSPYFGSLLATTAIALGGTEAQQRELCPALARGEKIASLALSEPGGSWDPGQASTRSVANGNGFELTGTKTHVLFGHAASQIVVPALSEDGRIALFVVDLPTEGARVEPEIGVDPTRRTVRLVLERVQVPASRRLGGDALLALEATHAQGYALLACEMVGTAEAVLGLTRAYAIERKQFDRAIGSFQAVKHPIVDIMVGVELARSQAFGALVAFDSDPAAAPVAARMAKALASDLLAFAVRKGVQLHGGYGFTWDCDVHFHFKRALFARALLGDAIHHRRHLAAALFDSE